MVTEPNISQAELIDLLNEKYPLQIKSLTFLPKGEVSWVYVVEGVDGIKYLLKIHKAKILPVERFKLLNDLHEKAGINGLTYPLPTKDGTLQIEILGYPSVVFNYIEGKTAGESKPTDKEYEKFGALLSQIHQAINIVDYPVREAFDVPTKDDFLKVLSHLESGNENSTLKKEAFGILKPLRARLEEELVNLEVLQSQLRSSQIDFVLCHGEPSPDNIMVDNDGEPYLIDWDEPIMAPKEKDLLFFGLTLEPVLKGYSQHSSDTVINKDIERFYSLLWNVNEIADWGDRIFFADSSEEELKHSLDQLKDFLDYSGLGDGA